MRTEKLNKNVIVQRAHWVLQMVSSIRDLPLDDKNEFLSNQHYAAAAESYLRRALEALFDLGRHILAKSFAYPAPEYKEIAKGLLNKKVLTGKKAELMRKMAGYRNRMVHFYHEISPQELYNICTQHLDEILLLKEAFVDWVQRKEKENSD
ncbi:MAG: DUF86 domain-containing protein [Candidatus Aminicenantes bacterium]